MNQAMAQLAEKLGIDHAKLPREKMAEVVCEKALEALAQQNSELAELKAFLQKSKAHALEKRELFIASRIDSALLFINQYEQRKKRA